MGQQCMRMYVWTWPCRIQQRRAASVRWCRRWDSRHGGRSRPARAKRERDWLPRQAADSNQQQVFFPFFRHHSAHHLLSSFTSSAARQTSPDTPFMYNYNGKQLTVVASQPHMLTHPSGAGACPAERAILSKHSLGRVRASRVPAADVFLPQHLCSSRPQWPQLVLQLRLAERPWSWTRRERIHTAGCAAPQQLLPKHPTTTCTTSQRRICPGPHSSSTRSPPQRQCDSCPFPADNVPAANVQDVPGAQT